MTAQFLLTSLIVVASPGTGVLYTLGAGLSRGARAGVVAAVGCTLGIVPHMVAAVTGLAALVRVGGLAFEVLRVAGVGYLLFMAAMTLRERGALTVRAAEPRPAVRVILSGVLVNLLNPKLTIFFFAFLPQFVGPRDPHSLPRMLELSGVFMALTFVVFAGYGAFAATIRSRVVSQPSILAWLRRVFAAGFLALAARLGLES
jgi:threonine/homoserine/homoserine lactone efflux protein